MFHLRQAAKALQRLLIQDSQKKGNEMTTQIRNIRDLLMNLHGSLLAYEQCAEDGNERATEMVKILKVAIELTEGSQRALGSRSPVSAGGVAITILGAEMAVNGGDEALAQLRSSLEAGAPADQEFDEMDDNRVTARELNVAAIMTASVVEDIVLRFKAGTLDVGYFERLSTDLEVVCNLVERTPHWEILEDFDLDSLSNAQEPSEAPAVAAE